MENRAPPALAPPFAFLAIAYLAIYAFPGQALQSVRDPAALLEKSRELIRAGDFSEALVMTRRLHDTFPNSHVYLDQLATLHNRLGNSFEEAIALEKFMSVAPSPAEACPALSDAYYRLGEKARMVSAALRCLNHEPRNSDLIFYGGLAQERAGNLEAAIDAYSRAAEIAPDNPDNPVGVARVWLRMGKVVEAREAASRVLKGWPEYIDAILVLAQAQVELGALSDARATLDRGLALKPASPELHAVAGELAEKQDDIPGAVRSYEAVLKTNPEHAGAKARLRALGGGSGN